MSSTLRFTGLGLALAALALTAASLGGVARFEAQAPSARLAPVGDAAETVQILQGTRSVLWTALSGPVVHYRMEGWPVQIDDSELGGALVLERPADALAGVIETAARPQSLVFQVGG